MDQNEQPNEPSANTSGEPAGDGSTKKKRRRRRGKKRGGSGDGSAQTQGAASAADPADADDNDNGYDGDDGSDDDAGDGEASDSSTASDGASTTDPARKKKRRRKKKKSSGEPNPDGTNQPDARQAESTAPDGRQQTTRPDDTRRSDGRQDGRRSDGRQQETRQPDGRKPDGRRDDAKQPSDRQADGNQTDGRPADAKQPDGRRGDTRQGGRQKQRPEPGSRGSVLQRRLDRIERDEPRSQPEPVEAVAPPPTNVTSVDSYVSHLRGWQREVVTTLRTLIRNAAPEAEESIKWSQPVYEYNGPVCYIKAFSDHVNFGFWRGVELDDSDNLLVGDLMKMRHVRIGHVNEVQRDTFERMVRQAVKLNKDKGDPTA